MTSRLLPVNIKQNNYYDGQSITEADMTDEQSRNVGIDAATENNFFGGGVLDERPTQPVILDSYDLNTQQQSLLDSYSFDGSNVALELSDVSDIINGVQLEVTLTGVHLDGAAYTKVCIIGDEFGDNLIHDDLIFNRNGTQVTRGRYKSIRAILFNNFAGNLNGSLFLATEADGYALEGRCTVKESVALETSRDTTVSAQIAEPSQYFNTFYPASSSETITEMLTNAIGSDKSFSDLNISLTSYAQRELGPNDITTRIGQKFQAKGNNIQKISVLLSVKYDSSSAMLPNNDGYEWSGSVVLTLHELQTSVACPVSPVPDNAIDFDPNPAIFAQLTLNSSDLAKQGIDLDGYVRCIDFTFTGSTIADPLRSNITEDKYYVLTVGRSGNADIGTILVEEATNRLTNSYMTVYDGTQWVNVLDSDMWFAVYGTYVKTSDGMAYDEGIGVQVPKIAKDSTNTEVPYVNGFLPFYTVTRDAYNYVLLETGDEFSDPTQDQRTGNLVYSRVTSIPVISLENQSSIDTLIETNPDPVLLARVQDQNPRGNPSSISGETCLIGLAYGNTFNILRPDADIQQNNLIGSILLPADDGCSDYKFRIIKQTLYSDAYGDVNGDGVVTSADLTVVNEWINSYGSVDITNSTDQLLFTSGIIKIDEFLRADVNGDGIVDSTDANLIQNFIDKDILTFPVGSNFSRMELIVESLLNPLTSTADIPAETCGAFDAPFTSCVPWKIEYFATWIPDFIEIEDLRRLLATTFTDNTTIGGKNDWFVPGDLLIGGNMLNQDGTPYSIDFEVNHLSLNMPVTDSYGAPVFLDGYTGILLFDNFVAESSNGLTSSGFNAMKYSDGTYVQIADFADNKVKISVAIQSIASEYDVVSGAVKDLIGVYYDPSTSLMDLYLYDGYSDGYSDLIPALSTKILMVAYLKKAGFANQTSEITQAQIRTLLGI